MPACHAGDDGFDPRIFRHFECWYFFVYLYTVLTGEALAFFRQAGILVKVLTKMGSA